MKMSEITTLKVELDETKLWEIVEKYVISELEKKGIEITATGKVSNNLGSEYTLDDGYFDFVENEVMGRRFKCHMYYTKNGGNLEEKTKSKVTSDNEPKCTTYADGTKRWYLDGKLHRVDGPAIEWADGTKKWYLDGKLHRVGGPAIEWADGDKEWWLNGVRQEEPQRAVEIWKEKQEEIW